MGDEEREDHHVSEYAPIEGEPVRVEVVIVVLGVAIFFIVFFVKK
jgi:hypothetical protein